MSIESRLQRLERDNPAEDPTPEVTVEQILAIYDAALGDYRTVFRDPESRGPYWEPVAHSAPRSERDAVFTEAFRQLRKGEIQFFGRASREKQGQVGAPDPRYPIATTADLLARTAYDPSDLRYPGQCHTLPEGWSDSDEDARRFIERCQGSHRGVGAWLT